MHQAEARRRDEQQCANWRITALCKTAGSKQIASGKNANTEVGEEGTIVQ